MRVLKDFSSSFVRSHRTKLKINKLSFFYVILFYVLGIFSLDVYAQNKIKEKEEGAIEVVGERDRPDFVRLKPEEINKMPGTFGDSLKAVFNIPGIAPIFQNYTNAGFQSAMATGLNPTAPNNKSPDISNSQRGFLVARSGY
ncbi:hypothetical protein LEP1GSC121_4092 [Leptospira borgpetersenii serovar Castellonis str. 200801910]|nr:TonB-dependent receptor [Leptospira borgpetersenii str. 4E]EKR01789.1 hypothetical protein LEP1GSC121_4092 [Leptospira borgpetersenii serovar Castellonis str. 200801910]